MSKNLKDFVIYADEGGSIYLECEVCLAIVNSEAYSVQELIDKANKHVCMTTEDKYKYNWDGELSNYYKKKLINRQRMVR